MKRALLAAVMSCMIACGANRDPSSGEARSASSGPVAMVNGESYVQRAIGIGRILHAYDRVAAQGTDVMLANVDGAELATFGGYLIERHERGWSVLFFTKEESPRICARIGIDLEAPSAFRRVNPPEPPTAAERVAIRARQAALAAVPTKIQPLNPVVLAGADAVEARRLSGELTTDPASDQKIVIYLLAGSNRPRVAVLGRHYRAVARSDGTLEKIEPMSKGPIEISESEMPPGVTRVGLFVKHVLGDWPTEAHVFASLLYGKPILVATAREAFRVDGDTITRVERPAGF